MSFPLSGYVISRALRTSSELRSYEVAREGDGQLFVARVREFDDPMVQLRVVQRLERLRMLDASGVARVVAVEQVGKSVVVLSERAPGMSLHERSRGHPVAVGEVLSIATQLCSIVTDLHARVVMHGDLRPATIAVDPQTRVVMLADPGIGRVLGVGITVAHEVDYVDALLPYLAPEQLGRAANEPDERSDLHAIGVTLYELLTGRRPFSANTVSELTRAQLVRRPRSPQELRPAIPTMLAAIVMRLLEKQPDQRYQSARGLAFDLARVTSAIAEGELEPSFVLGERDFPTSLRMPRRLYGRAHVVAQLEQELADVRERGESRAVFLLGDAGLGKSALLRSFAAPFGSNVILAAGRFDADERGRPYRGFVEALGAMIEQLAGGSDVRRSELRQHLRERLGGLLELAIDLVPALTELFVGQVGAPSETHLGPREVERRVHVSLRRLFAALAERSPIVMLLDDVQRLDPGSRELLRVLGSGIGGPILMIAAIQTRDDAADESLLELRRALVAEHGASELLLEPLGVGELVSMLSNMLGRSARDLGPLVEHVRRRTSGNPLLIRHVLYDWVEQGVLSLGDEGWAWRPELGDAAALDVGSLLAARMARLGSEERLVLRHAACVGMVVELALLRQIAGLEDLLLADALSKLEDEGVLVAEGAEHRFAHERLLELAEGSLAPEERARIHWRIAAVLRERGGEPGFALLDHVVAGLPAAGRLDEAERRRLVELARAGARRAVNSAAWANAERYEATALVLASGLPPDPVRNFALHSAHAEALALIGRHEEGAREFATLLEHPLEPSELGRLVARRLEILTSQDRHAEVLELGLATLRRFGLHIRPSRASLAFTALRAWRGVRKLGRERLLALPAVADARVAAQLLIADAMQTSAFLVRRELSVELNALQVLLVVRHGFHPVAPRALSQFGILVVVLGRPLLAAELAEWALELATRAPAELRPRVETAARLFVWPHSRPLVGSLRGIEDLFERALAAGDRDTAGYVGGLGLRGLIESGAPLRELSARAKRLHDGLIGWATRDQRALIGNSKRLIEALIDGAEASEFDRVIDREGEIGEVIRYGAMTTFAIGDFLLGRRKVALARLEPLAVNFFAVTIGTWLFGRFSLLRAVSAVSAIERGELSRRGVARWLRGYRERLVKLAAIVPANFAAPLHVVTAELHRLHGEHDEALSAYELARSEAEQHGQLYAAGIAAERLAELAGAHEQPLTRVGALKLARDVYLRWGASAVVARLEREHADLFAPRDHESSTVTPAKTDEGSWVPDGHATLALMQALGEELNLEQVITRVLAAAIEHAGADRGVLVLERDGAPGIVAEGGVGSVSEYLDAPVPLSEAGDRLPRRIVEQVLRTGRAVIFDEFDHDPELGRDPYFVSHAVPSLLCLPIVKLHRRVGALLLEHESPMQEFTFERLEILRSFASQAASALDNARLYEALQRSEAQWRSLVGGVPDVITVIDEQSRFEFTNHVGGFPIDPQSVIGTPAEAIIAPAQLPSWREALQAVRAGQGPRELECQIAPPGFERRWYLVRLAGIEVAGRVGRVITIATNIEERKRDESDRARLEAQLRQQQRLESLGTLASGVAHEINNPIQGIMNYAELVRGRPDDRGMVEEFAGEISHESRRVATIVRNLMAFSRQEREQQQLERVEVGDLIENTLTLIRAVLRKDRIELQLILDEGLPPLHCRSAQIQQILMNLVTNARDALNERGVGVERRTLVLHASTWIREGRPWLRMSVADQGGGIDEAVLGRIFDPFFTTKGRDQGTGLGLAVSHGIALEHGGLLWVDNQPGVGATFNLDLPALASR